MLWSFQPADPELGPKAQNEPSWPRASRFPLASQTSPRWLSLLVLGRGIPDRQEVGDEPAILLTGTRVWSLGHTQRTAPHYLERGASRWGTIFRLPIVDCSVLMEQNQQKKRALSFSPTSSLPILDRHSIPALKSGQVHYRIGQDEVGSVFDT